MIPPELAGRTWLAVRDQPGHRVGHRYGSLRAALAANPDGFVVSDEVDGWTWLFAGRNAPLLDPKVASLDGGEACRFSLVNGQLEVARYKDGAVVRRVAGAGAGPPEVDEGLRGHKREPPLDPFDADAVLAMARAWRCDPVAELDRTRANGVPGYARVPAAPRTRAPPVYPRRLVFQPSGRLVAGLVALLVALGILTARPGSRERTVTGTWSAPLGPCDRYDCAPCMSCALQPGERCAQPAADCGRDAECAALSRCYDDCKGEVLRQVRALDGAAPGASVSLDGSCDARCEAAHPDAVTPYRAWVTCAACDVCEEPCAPWMRVPIGDLRRAACAQPAGG